MGRTYPPAIAALYKFRRTTAMALALALVGVTGNGLRAQDASQAPAAEAAGDENTLDALTSAISSYKKNLQAIKDALREAPEPSALTGELTTAKDIIDDLTVQLNQVRTERDAVRSELIEYRENADATIASLRLDSERDRGLMAQIQAELGQTKTELADTVETRTALEDLLAEQQATADELEAQLRSDLSARQSQISELQTVRDSLQADLSDLRQSTTAEIDALTEQVTASTEENETLRGDLTNARQQVAALESEGEALQGELEGVTQAATAQAADLTAQIEAATSRADSLGGRLTVSEQQVVELQEAQQLLETELTKLTETSERQTADLKSQLTLARQEITDREASYDELSKQMAEATAAAANETASVVAELEETQAQLTETEEQRATLQIDFASFRQSATSEKQSLESELDQTLATVVGLEATRDGLNGQISEATVTAERCVADVSELGEQLIAALDHLEQLEAALAQAQAGRSALAAELTAVRQENGQSTSDGNGNGIVETSTQ